MASSGVLQHSERLHYVTEPRALSVVSLAACGSPAPHGTGAPAAGGDFPQRGAWGRSWLSPLHVTSQALCSWWGCTGREFSSVPSTA